MFTTVRTSIFQKGRYPQVTKKSESLIGHDAASQPLKVKKFNRLTFQRTINKHQIYIYRARDRIYLCSDMITSILDAEAQNSGLCKFA